MQNTSPPPLFSATRRNAVEARALRGPHHDADFLTRETAEILADRLNATNRNFSVAYDLFSPFDCMAEHLQNSRKVENLFRTAGISSCFEESTRLASAPDLAAERELLPFKPGSANLVTSVFGLHWSNDLPGTFAQIRKILMADGLFLAALPGDKTLHELRDCLITAESQLSGSANLRVEPYGEIRQFGQLLQRTGFALPVVDSEIFNVRYQDFSGLIRDLRAMGATNTLSAVSGFGPRNLFEEVEKVYQEKYSDPDGKIRATFEVVFLSGWTPHESQQKPLKPGSAKNLLKDFL